MTLPHVIAGKIEPQRGPLACLRPTSDYLMHDIKLRTKVSGF